MIFKLHRKYKQPQSYLHQVHFGKKSFMHYNFMFCTMMYLLFKIRLGEIPCHIFNASLQNFSTFLNIWLLTLLVPFNIPSPDPKGTVTILTSIFLITNKPSMTLPKTMCFPSRKSHLAHVMKNWHPLVFDPAFAWREVNRWLETKQTTAKYGLSWYFRADSYQAMTIH